MRPVICMITVPHADGEDAERDLIARMRAAALAGVHLIQIRQPQRAARALGRLVEQAVVAVRGTAARVLVNDRVDVALAAGAHGVHLRGDSMPASQVRAIVPPGFVIGRSVHSPDEAVQVFQDGGLDYLIFGTVFPTASKPGAAVAGIAALAATCAAVPLPVLAIGGVTFARAGLVADAGSAGFAAISLFDTPHPVP